MVHITCDVRIYGGWYEKDEITKKAQDITIKIQNDFPHRFTLPMKDSNTAIKINVNAELAFSMLEEPQHHLLNTYRRKGKPANIRIKKTDEINCSNKECVIPKMKNLLKKGKCPILECTEDNLLYRHEQKLVDTMFTCDLIYAPSLGYRTTIIVSSDDDFLPPIRTLLLRGSPVIRFHPKSNNQRQTNSHNIHKQLREMEL